MRREPRRRDKRGALDRRLAEDHRLTEDVALTELHAEVHQAFEVGLGLDTLGDDSRVDVRAEREHRHHECAARVAGGAVVQAERVAGG